MIEPGISGARGTSQTGASEPHRVVRKRPINKYLNVDGHSGNSNLIWRLTSTTDEDFWRRPIRQPPLRYTFINQILYRIVCLDVWKTKRNSCRFCRVLTRAQTVFQTDIRCIETLELSTLYSSLLTAETDRLDASTFLMKLTCWACLNAVSRKEQKSSTYGSLFSQILQIEASISSRSSKLFIDKLTYSAQWRHRSSKGWYFRVLITSTSLLPTSTWPVTGVQMQVDVDCGKC